ncbi:MAG: hypothetical protein DIU78_021915 [Pseudomonadota bacterium]|nr:MAG: hypothetical protein DIU78_10800 [Pseudomonadota bacterium]
MIDRRTLLGAAISVSALALLGSAPTEPKSYLHRAALLLAGARRESDLLRQRFGDKELARLVYHLAEARRRAASTMMVPKEVAQAHPHLLLAFENYERAADAALIGESKRFLVLSQRAYDEERTFRAVLRQFGHDLPQSKDGS